MRTTATGRLVRSCRSLVAASTGAVVVVLVALAVTAFPVIAVAAGSAERVSDVGPLVVDLWQRVTGGS